MGLFQRWRARSNAIPARSPAVQKFFNLLLWLMAAFGFVMFFGLSLSPWLGDRFGLMFENTVRVEARISACEPWRNGVTRENTIRCAFSYSHEGKTYQSRGTAWSSKSPFITSNGLRDVLNKQALLTTRFADIRPRHPEDARLADQRWLAMPPLWMWLLLCVGALVALLVYLELPATIYRRADLVVDPATGELTDANNKRRNRMRWLAALRAATALFVILACLYGLSNRPANAIRMMALNNLQAVPAQLVECARQRHGTYRGHDQIECAFEYTFNGQTLRGQAEALDFRYFPTRARIDAEVAQLQPFKNTTAYVDPQHPGYAWAFISDDWWVKYTWGLWELELWFAILVALGFLLGPALMALKSKQQTP